MMGMISAISSALCISLLVFISVVCSYISGVKETISGLFLVKPFIYEFPINAYYLNSDVVDDLMFNIDSNDLNVKELQVGCEFGFDANRELIEPISIFNSLELNRYILNNDLDLNVRLLDVNEEKISISYCFIRVIEYES